MIHGDDSKGRHLLQIDFLLMIFCVPSKNDGFNNLPSFTLNYLCSPGIHVNLKNVKTRCVCKDGWTKWTINAFISACEMDGNGTLLFFLKLLFLNKVHVSIFFLVNNDFLQKLIDFDTRMQEHAPATLWCTGRFDADAPEVCKSFEATFFPRPDWTHAQVKPVHVSIPSMQCNDMENWKQFFSTYRVKFAQTISNT